ncbi:beta strand repeat-containing protein [Kutzneria sp. CA-103260]|uniref:beta strand repeat-containing protein n=1 Tax=Kutzneria sp. CA-103260 TaxID=2802641 RepID=UPI001BAB37B0|nr:chaplin family protein [Kutzneria sp. CA-103260]QUQ70038.1 ChpA-C [Kutzneria sp. CA-103260]
MQTWAKRGLQAALLTGGLIAVGTGVANASEAQPAHPLGVPATDLVDVNVKVPLSEQNNQLGTVLGKTNLPAVSHTVSTRELTGKLAPHPLATPQGKNIPVAVPQNISRGNTIPVDLCVPVDISGNAIGATGDAATVNHSKVGCDAQSVTATDGYKGSIAGNIIGVDYGLPIQLDNNAIAAAGNAAAAGTADAATATGTTPFLTNGDKGTLAGNIVDAALGTPVQVTGNAIGVGGNSETASKATTNVVTGGLLQSSGNGGTLAGNLIGVPLGLPVEANGNSISWVGNADAKNHSEGAVQAGDINEDGFYALTAGDPSTVSGNIVQAPIVSKALVAGNAVSWIGNANALGVTENELVSGGKAGTNGVKSTGSGNIIDPEVALPVEVFGDGVTWIGTAEAADLNKVTALAGGNTYTDGDKSTLGGNDVVAPVAGAVDVFGSAASWIGNASGTAGNISSVNDGGYNGTLGNGAVGGGNIASVPVALPAEVFGAGASLTGNADGLAKEVKDVEAGDKANTNDDRGTVSSNVASVPVTAPVQLFGDAAGLVANVTGGSQSTTTTTAGHDVQANGDKGSASGNAAQVPVALPTQLFGDTATLVGNGDAIAKGVTSSTAGGDVDASGKGGSITGNIADVPVAGAIQGFGAAIAGAGVDNATATNLTSSMAGGSDTTSGTAGSVAGNVAQVPLAPVVGVLGDTVTAAGVGNSAADNKVFDTAGKDVVTDGLAGAISGNVAKVPAAATADVLGDAVTAGGIANALAHSYTDPSAGGDTTTTGKLGSVAGNVAQVPAAANAQVLSDSVGALGNAANDTTAWTGNFAGGNTHTSGMFGAISGNLAQAPLVGNAQVLDDAVGAGGLAFDKSSTSAINTAGGESTTSGVLGSVAGNLLSVPVGADGQVNQDALSAAGQAFHAGANKVVDLAGGDVATNGTGGSISGDLLQVPAGAVAGVFTDAATVGGISATKGTNVTDFASGGSQATAGAMKTLSGLNGHLPVGALVQVFDVPLEVFGTALANGQNITSAVVGEEHPLLDLPVSSRLLGAAELPTQRDLPSAASLPLAGLGVDSVMGLLKLLPAGALPGMPAQERDLPSLSGVLPTDNLVPGAHLAQLPTLDGVRVTPNVAGGARDLPGQELLGDLGSMTEGLHIA